MSEHNNQLKFSQQELKQLLLDLNKELKKEQIRGEICILGGAVMLLAWNSRELTRDIDAVFKPEKLIKNAAEKVAHSNSLGKIIPLDWLNDGVKGFIDKPPEPNKQKLLYDFSHLKVMHPPAEYLIAMKSYAARVGEETADSKDLKFLMKKMNIQKANEVIDIVEKYYPNRQLPAKTKFFIESVAEELSNEKAEKD